MTAIAVLGIVFLPAMLIAVLTPPLDAKYLLSNKFTVYVQHVDV
jgi:hypothetical protein